MTRPPAQRQVPLAKPTFGEEEEKLLIDVLRSGWVTQGPRVEEFERLFATTVGSAEAIAVSSGTAALFLSMVSLGIGPGSEVIVPSLSFIATANAVVHTGATPVFVDVDPATYNIDVDALDAAVTEHTRAVVVVHQLGNPADLDRIDAIARRRGFQVVEDAACALGSLYKGDPIGSFGNLAAFSFHPRKVVVTGEGGMIATNDPQRAALLRRLRHQGMSVSDLERHRAARVIIERYPEVGYNFRMSDLHAALGLVQMGRLNEFVEKRRAIAGRYDRALGALDVVPANSSEMATPNYQSYIVRLPNSGVEGRDRILDEMQRRGVASRRGLMAIHQQECYRDATIAGSMTHTNQAAEQTILLPIYPDLREDDQRFVVETLSETLDAIGPSSPT